MVKFTLHDIFGYLFPGFVTLAAIAIWMWPYCLPQTMEGILQYKDFAWPLVILMLIVAYILGSLVLSVAEVFLFAGSLEKSLPASITKQLKSKVNAIIGEGGDAEKDEERKWFLGRTCDEYVLQFEKGDHWSAKREMFFYRLDYCRGSVIAFLLLALSSSSRLVYSLVYRWLGDSGRAQSDLVIQVGILLLSILAILAFYNRFKRFWGLLQYNIAINFLLLQHDKEEKAKE